MRIQPNGDQRTDRRDKRRPVRQGDGKARTTIAQQVLRRLLPQVLRALDNQRPNSAESS
jgi:hypothetical protein